MVSVLNLGMTKSDPSWKSAEKLVAAIEKSLAPEARVEHDVQLPVLGQSRARQCDVVIRIGRDPREQLFIVEVQKRKAKPDITTFGGWLRKMEEVGASGLICVSEAGFPESIIEDVATKIGPKVRLVTLDPESEQMIGMPFHLVPELVRTTHKIRNVDATDVKLHDISAEEPQNGNAIQVSYLKNSALSHDGSPSSTFPLSSIIESGLVERDPYSENSDIEIGEVIEIRYTTKATEKAPLWFHTEQGIVQISEITVRASVQRIDVSEPMTYSKWTYKQEFHDSTMAWAAMASFDVEGETFEMKLIFTPDENGFLTPSLNLEHAATLR